MEQMKRELIEQAAHLNTREEYIAWEQRCDVFIESLEEQSRVYDYQLDQTIVDRLYRATRNF